VPVFGGRQTSIQIATAHHGISITEVIAEFVRTIADLAMSSR
jgi:hypothetical protein